MRIARIFLSLTILSSLLGCQAAAPDGLPGELLGVWKTSASKYKDCTIELTKDYIIFTNNHSAGHVDTNFVLGMKQAPVRGHFLYTILYENIHAQKYKFSFYYYPAKNGAIRLKNQKDVEWRKVKPSSGHQISSGSG